MATQIEAKATEPRGIVSRVRAALDVLMGKRSLTSDSTLAQLGGGTGWGGFDAAKLGRLTNDWPAISRSADQDLQVDLRKLRARARYQAMNSPTAAKFLNMVRNNVVGEHGVKISFKVPKARKTKNGSLDDKINAELKAKFKQWGKKGSCTVCGRYSWREVQLLMAENWARDGEQIVRFVFVPKTVNPFGFQLQILDADQLDDNYNQLGRADSVQVRMGVEVNQYQMPLAYHLFNGNPYEVSNFSSGRTRVPAEYIRHLFTAHRTGQTRGYPFFASSMGQLKMLDGYFMAELTGARISSQLIMSIESADDSGDDGITGDGLNADGSKALDIGNGTAIELGAGQKLLDHTPAHPTNAFESFMKQSGRMVASGLNVPYHALFSDLSGVNFSSARIGEMEVREFWKELQSLFIDNMLEPVYEAWQRSAQMNGALDVPLDFERYTGDSLKWEPKRWPWVDPLKDVQATTLEIQNGFITHEAEAASRGRDWREDFDQLKVEQDYADELGLALGTDIRGQGTSEVNNEDETPESAGGADEPKDGDEKPAKPKAGTKPAPAKPKTPRPGKSLVRGMHPANAALWDLTEENE